MVQHYLAQYSLFAKPALLTLVFLLAACDPIEPTVLIDGNPGTNQAGSSTTSQTNTQTAGRLVINEVGSSYYGNTMRWFELYNTGGSAVELGDYQLRSRAIDAGLSISASQLFNLPSTTVNAGQYLIVRAQSMATPAVDTSRVVHLEQAGLYPYWDANGFLELQNASTGDTVDYVTFGTLYSPTDTSAWTDSTAPTLVSTTSSFGQSIGRNGTSDDSNQSSDWNHSDWATIGGPNDVLCNTDNDTDLIPDCNEQSGTTFAGLPLYDWGARSGQPDIFIEVDYMDATDGGNQVADEGIIPRQEALQAVVDAFNAQGIAVHFDVGDLFDGAAGLNPAQMDLGGGGQVPFAPGMTIGTGAGLADLYDYKRDYMAYNRLPIFHYLVFANSQQSNGSPGSTGLAEQPGNDLLVTLGSGTLNTASAAETNRLINYQAGTVMHELGHNLNLGHGGGDNTNFKPNYLSVMNYLYQLNGLPQIGTDEGDRFYQSPTYQNEDGNCFSGLNQGPTDSYTGFRLDYSDGSAIALDPTNLDETLGLGEVASGNVDFNCNGTDTDTGVNYTTGSWTDYDDWANLQLDFGGYNNLNNHGSRLISFRARQSESLLRLPDPVGNDRTPVANEAPLLIRPAPQQSPFGNP